MKMYPLILIAVAGLVFGGCATHVSKSKRQQVELVTHTGPYAYLGPPGGGPGR
jgi:hypothetical protein